MFIPDKPYLIIPKLIEQSTWGGDYIASLKNWQTKKFLKGRKIGQSYELFGDSKLALHCTDTRNAAFIPELGFADKPDIVQELFPLEQGVEFETLSKITQTYPDQILGEKHASKSTMPLLIKMNQAAGNSFQLHIRPTQNDKRWQPKPESWYFLEDGTITCGIRQGIDIKEYQKCCERINTYMQQISQKIMNGEISLEDGRGFARQYIAAQNPWQFVNTYQTKKYDLIDLSAGGIHHSWEENKTNPHGNVVYEVQVDVMDPVCTIRSFDQGKIKEDGSIRELHIDDFFRYIDSDPRRNDITVLKAQRAGEKLLRSPYYAVDILELSGKIDQTTKSGFCHLYVRDGLVEVASAAGTVVVSQGHSCFVPAAVRHYSLTPLSPNSVILKTFLNS